MSETNQHEQQLSPEEIEAYKKQMTEFYKSQLPMLKLQKEYEQLLADIEESRAKRMTMTIRMAQMMAGPPPEQDPEPEEKSVPDESKGEKKERKLKTE